MPVKTVQSLASQLPSNPSSLGQAAHPLIQSANAAQGPTPASSLSGALGGMFGAATLPGIAQSTAGLASGQQQLGVNAAEYTDESSYIGQNLSNQLAQMGISGQQIGLQQQGLQQQQQIEPQQYALQQQSQGIQGQGLGAQLAQSQYQQGRAVQNQQGAAGASGSTSSVGNNRALGDIAQQFGFQQGEIGRQQQQLGISEKQAGLSQQLTQGSMNRQGQALALTAKSLGISEQQANQQATQALQQLGLSSYMSAQDIWDGIAAANQGLTTPISPYLGSIYSIISGSQPSQP